ncbi:HalOD1 output domain-containing protein [Halorussus halophilus]|uniref:HalOD1 output domain-containing protein n=1 Tax=Halorussus halophilus TaxID=2650975 RepID=UPI0013015CAE|nr:HalOD1 output domain-containing protein [Halorussus halophilus]
MSERARQTLRDGESASTAIVDAVSEVTGTPATELPPLDESIDAGALDQLFDRPTVPQKRRGVVVFEMADCLVAVTSQNTITVTKVDGDGTLAETLSLAEEADTA